MLVLSIKKEHLEKMITGEKKVDYREIKPFYNKKFKRYLPRYNGKNEIIFPKFNILFRNGQDYKSNSIKCVCKLEMAKGEKKWGAKPNKEYYVIHILEILEVKKYEK